MRQNDFIYPDNGCIEATQYQGYQSRCMKCPFADCIYSLRYREKMLILQHDKVTNVLICASNGMTLYEINAIFKEIPFTTIRNWLKYKDKIIPKLQKYIGVEIAETI